MNIAWDTLWLPKRGNAVKEYEDSFWPEALSGTSALSKKFAVADGASESIQSGPWARILTKCYCRTRSVSSRRSASGVVSRARKEWDGWKSVYLRRRQESGFPLQWYEEPGFEKGAFSTLLGVGIRLPGQGGDPTLTAFALGDTCLFLVRDGEMTGGFPARSSSEFGWSPLCVSSNPASDKGALESAVFLKPWNLRKGDRLYLVTDALAAWFLVCWEMGGDPWATLDEASGLRSAPGAGKSDPSKFAGFVETLRSDKAIRNDDVTLTRIELV